LLKNGISSKNIFVYSLQKMNWGRAERGGTRGSYFHNTESLKRCFTWVMAVLPMDKKTAKTASHLMRYLEAHCQICEVFLSVLRNQIYTLLLK